MGIILKQLTETFNTSSPKIINKKKFDIDQLTSALNDTMTKYVTVFDDDYNNADAFSQYYNDTILENFESEFDVEVSKDMSINEVLQSLKGACSDKVLLSISKFAETNSAEKSSPLAVLWANVIVNTVNKDTKNNNEIIEIFNHIIKQDDTYSLTEIKNQTLEILKNNFNCLDYFYSSLITSWENKTAFSWFDFSGLATNEIDLQVENLQISSVDQLADKSKDFENMASLIEYIKSNYLTKEDDLIAEYKALAVLTNIFADERFNSNDIDKNNNIGLNLSLKLMKLEELIGLNYPQFRNTDAIKGIKGNAKNIANEILGKKKEHKYQPIIKVLQQYKRRLDFMEDNADMVKDYYLRRFGIENKTTEEVEDFLGAKEKRVEKIIKKIKINAVTKIDPALKNWEENLKTEYPDPLKLPGKNIKELTDIIGSPLLAQAVYFARKQKSQLLGEDKNSNINDDSSQLDLFDQLDLQ